MLKFHCISDEISVKLRQMKKIVWIKFADSRFYDANKKFDKYIFHFSHKKLRINYRL